MLSTSSAPADLEWSAQAKQRRFLIKFAVVDELLGGGSAGGGKSDALLAFNLLRREKYPTSSGLFLRRNFTELFLQGGAVPRSHQLFSGKAAWNGQDKKWTFPNGSVLQFGHLNTEDAKYHYHSGAFEDICFDEVTSFTESQYLYMASRARSVIPGCRAKIRGGTNPGNVGHGWVKTRFIDSQPPLTVGWFVRRNDQDAQVSDPENHPDARSRAFVPFRLEDNEYLWQGGQGQYGATLAALPEDDYRALRWGDWDAWSGQVFKRFQRHRHVIEPRRFGTGVTRWTCLDWGYESPFVCLWLAAGARLPSDPDTIEDPRTGARIPAPRCSHEHLYCYRELTLRRLLDAEHARACRDAMEPDERIDAWMADPSSFFAHVDRTGPIPADVWESETGIRLIPSNNDRIMGKRAVDAALADCACGVPILRFFSTCHDTIRTLPMLGYDPIRVEDVLKSSDDHHYDTLRYGLMGPRPTRRDGAERSRVAVGGLHA